MGLFREQGCFAAAILRERGLSLEELRKRYAHSSNPDVANRLRVRATEHRIEIHGFQWHAETIRERVKILRQFNWHWERRPWKARDLAVAKDGSISFDVSLSKAPANFDLSTGAWKKDHCPICNWEMFESEKEHHHRTGYTNGRDWVCTECFEKFLSNPDYFTTSHPDIT